MLKLSIITINYNNLEGLKQTVASVVNQTWQEFEYIIIDGGSTDGSAAFIEEQCDNFEYWVSEKDSGIYNAMNKGIRVATGEYLLFLNSGDYLYKNISVEKSCFYLDEYDLVCFDIKIVGVNKIFIDSSPSKLRFSDMFYGTLPHQSTYVKKDLFDRIGLYDENLKIISDWKFFILALFKFNSTYLKVNEILAVFNTDGISWNADFSEEKKMVLEEHFGMYFLDYIEMQKNIKKLKENNKILDSNRFKMLSEIEKTIVGKKIVSIFFRIYIIIFSKSKLKDTVS
ncbi:glycosyltransferase involved in cell wall biosynthesis [Flavobacterium sp. CG_9.1]|uniref:glycosyltransferase family 2 protein n=1 Tax=Flavobacterium sp. CG_9.1 TaxID=2787728 RepID=UPI0018C96964|nr:glycosyltransferase family 2 protein [Flavobacterium sp. CG_9.1]MBG6062956.1 glycosyltransferase involved in cell wall biosynthesis [Flavobacterium sp. CG_9.1]